VINRSGVKSKNSANWCARAKIEADNSAPESRDAKNSGARAKATTPGYQPHHERRVVNLGEVLLLLITVRKSSFLIVHLTSLLNTKLVSHHGRCRCNLGSSTPTSKSGRDTGRR
jgi:hypothetical protein